MILAVLAIGYQCIVPINQNAPGIVLGKIPELGVKLIHSPVKVGIPNEIFEPAFDPNDPTIGYHIDALKMRPAWDFSRGNGVTVAVLDTGFDLMHEDLAGQWVGGRNVASDNFDVSPIHTHGTKTASCVGAVGNNLTGIVGTAFESKIMPIRVTNNTNGTASAFNLAKGITYAANNGARIISVSYGVTANNTVLDAVTYANSRGSAVFASMGNQNSFIDADNHPGIFGVGATDENGNKASFSNTGGTLDGMAPGNNVWVANPGGGYGTTSGTSFSCPYTAGVAACALGANPAMSWQQIMECVEQADDAGPAGYDTLWGWGRINAEKAVAYARSIQGNGNEPPPPDTTPPTISFNSPANGLVITQDQNIAVSVTAKDNTEVTKVVFWMNQFEYLTDSDGPSDLYGWNWNTQAWAEGSWTIKAVAYDAAGNSAEASVTVTLNRTGGDTQGPSLTIVNPKDGFTVSGNRLVVDLTFSDNVGVTYIQANIPGVQASRENPTSPLKFNFNVRKVPAGNFTLTVKARDAAGNETVKTVSLTKR